MTAVSEGVFRSVNKDKPTADNSILNMLACDALKGWIKRINWSERI